MAESSLTPSKLPAAAAAAAAGYGRIPCPNGFLPLATESVLSTRGQSLVGLIRNGSSGSVHISPQKRRRSVPRDEEATIESRTSTDLWAVNGYDSPAKATTMSPKMRSMRLIGNNNPRYHWERYIKSEEQLKPMKKPLRQYYERINRLVKQYMYIDRLLDSSLPHHLIQEYSYGTGQQPAVDIPQTISEETSPTTASKDDDDDDAGVKKVDGEEAADESSKKVKLKRTPKNLYRVPPDEDTPLLDGATDQRGQENGRREAQDEDDSDNHQAIVKLAIYINLAANTVLLAAKIAAIVLTNSLSVLASLVDAVLDFLSTAVVWTTTYLMARQDQYAYPIGRRRLEPIGVLVFSVIIVTSFFQVLLESFSRLTSGDHSIVQLTLPAILIMASTVVVKFLCWLWCRLIKNASVQALAQDAMTDVVFNTFSIIFPLGFYLGIWFLDALGGALLSLYVIVTWTRTSRSHIQHLTGAAADPDERNILLYLTMRFAHAIRQIQGLQAYRSTGEKLIVEVDVVLDENMPLRDSHDLGESLQYVLESVPFVDRAFVHLDYKPWNIPTHMTQLD